MFMEAKQVQGVREGRHADGAFGFSFSIAVGLILFIAGLLISVSTDMGVILGFPLLLVGVALPLVMMRGHLTQAVIDGSCPHCGTTIKTSDSTLRLDCPSCRRQVVIRDSKFYPVN